MSTYEPQPSQLHSPAWVAVTKTMRDLHEGGRLISRVEEAELERILSQHDPLVP